MLDIPRGRIVVALDVAVGAGEALRVAADLARRAGAELHVAHARQPTFLRVGRRASARRGAQALLAAQVRQLGTIGIPRVVAHHASGPPAEAIAALCRAIGADLLVIGDRGLNALQRLAMGSVAEALLHAAGAPVLVARGGARAWPPERVVVGDDGSIEARRAGTLAAQFGGMLRAAMLLVRVRPRLPRRDAAGNPLDARAVTAALLRDELGLKARAAEFAPLLGRRPAIALMLGDPAMTLLDVVGGDPQPTLVAVGKRGLGDAGPLHLGSTSGNLLRLLAGPLLVFPAGARLGHGLSARGRADTATRHCLATPEDAADGFS